MAGRLSLWGAGQMLSTMFSKVTEAPDFYYLALIQNVAPTAYLSGSELDEPDIGDYQRLEIPNDAVHWSNESTPQIMLTLEDLFFIAATADWGIIRFWALCNAQSGGFVYATGDLASPYTVLKDDVVILGAGDLTISLGPFFTSEA